MESQTTNNNINAIKEVRQLFNELKSNFSSKEITEIREKFRKKEVAYNFLKKKEHEDSLTNIEKNVLKNIDKYLKRLKKN